MLTFDVQRRLFWGLVWSFMVFAVIGCQATTPPRTRATTGGIEPASARSLYMPLSTRDTRQADRASDSYSTDSVDKITGEGAASPKSTKMNSTATPTKRFQPNARRRAPNQRPAVKPRRKPAEARDGEYDRHPARWRERLKAKYT